MFVTTLLLSQAAPADEYMIDSQGQHAFITFKVNHLNFSYIIGHFNRFEGNFTYDAEQPENSSAKVEIEANSLDTNHAERNKHLKGEDYLDVAQYPNIRPLVTSRTNSPTVSTSAPYLIACRRSIRTLHSMPGT
ncbi:MAG: YceI family protein, partial [Gammaproteobacteria bacterium]|nr:YceI family protein [Gammaproteobacteria bacterium]